jgi:hypothetical protein
MAVGRRAAVGTKRVQPVAAPLDGDKAASAAVPVQLHRSAGGDVWVPETQSCWLSCEFSRGVIGPR